MAVLSDIERRFREALRVLSLELEAAHQALMAEPQISLDGKELTKAVLLRVGSFYAMQEHAKRTLGTGAIGSGAYFFADSVFMYLKAVFNSWGTSVDVRSEKFVTTPGGKLKPDISVSRGETCIAVIECKTQMGWRRREWEQDFAKRQNILSRQDPPAEAFLLSLTNRGGPKTLETSDLLWDRYFVLAKDWPTGKSEPEVERLIWTDSNSVKRYSDGVGPLEVLFGKILMLATEKRLGN